MVETIVGVLFTMTMGSFGYTYLSTKDKASTKDIQDLKERIDLLYEHLLGKTMKEALKEKNGN